MDYQYLISLDKQELLELMVRFQEKRSAIGKLTMDLIKEGIPLFRALNQAADTQELKDQTSAYLRHLRYERANRLKYLRLVS